VSEGHSLPVEQRGRGESEHRAKEEKQASEEYSHAVVSAEGDHVRILKDRKQEKGTHFLSRTKGGTSRDSERTKKCKRGALTSYRVRREGKSGNGNEANERGCSLPVVRRGRDK